jgi:hypothetical protein
MLARILLACLAASQAAPAPGNGPIRQDQPLIIGEQARFTPGYAVGNIAVGNPAIADFKVLPGRRELLLFGKAPGRTLLTVWDQKNVARHEMSLIVMTREAADAEQRLRTLLRDYPTVRVEGTAGSLSVTGTSAAKPEFDAISRIAAAGGAMNAVRYTGPDDGPAGAGGGGAAPAPAAPRAVPHVQYEVELFEASSKYRTGSYAMGVEPSGRSLYRGKVDAKFDDVGEIFIGGSAVAAAKETMKDAPKAKGLETGLRLKMRPTAPAADGRFTTYVLIETNLPIGGDTYDPDVWRRARWEFDAGSAEPFGITGGDLLATPDSNTPARPGAVRSAAGASANKAIGDAASAIESKSSFLNYVPVFGSLFSSKSYKAKQTQLLVVIRPTIVSGGN